MFDFTVPVSHFLGLLDYGPGEMEVRREEYKHLFTGNHTLPKTPPRKRRVRGPVRTSLHKGVVRRVRSSVKIGPIRGTPLRFVPTKTVRLDPFPLSFHEDQVSSVKLNRFSPLETSVFPFPSSPPTVTIPIFPFSHDP